MAKFFGKVGYVNSVKTSPGVVEEQFIVREYYGDELKWGSRWKTGDKINDDVTITNQISIVADPFAYENFSKIRWVEWMDVLWKVESVQIERPRLVLSLGGVYNADSVKIGTSS